METIRLTTGQAIVRWLTAQRTMIDDVEVPVFPGVFGIFGHGNVTCLGEALEQVQDEMPTWRGHNEQSMALAAVGFAKARRRRQIMVASSSIGPGSTNMVTAAAVAHANRLPLLLFSGDTTPTFAATHQSSECEDPLVRRWLTLSSEQCLYALELVLGNYRIVLSFVPCAASNWVLEPSVIERVGEHFINSTD